MRLKSLAGALAILPLLSGCGSDLSNRSVITNNSGNNPAAVNDGDVNGDGSVDHKDMLLAQQITLGMTTPTVDQTNRGDMYADGVLDASDYLLIQKKVMGL